MVTSSVTHRSKEVSVLALLHPKSTTRNSKSRNMSCKEQMLLMVYVEKVIAFQNNQMPYQHTRVKMVAKLQVLWTSAMASHARLTMTVTVDAVVTLFPSL